MKYFPLKKYRPMLYLFLVILNYVILALIVYVFDALVFPLYNIIQYFILLGAIGAVQGIAWKISTFPVLAAVDNDRVRIRYKKTEQHFLFSTCSSYVFNDEIILYNFKLFSPQGTLAFIQLKGPAPSPLLDFYSKFDKAVNKYNTDNTQHTLIKKPSIYTTIWAKRAGLLLTATVIILLPLLLGFGIFHTWPPVFRFLVLLGAVGGPFKLLKNKRT